PGFMNFGRHKMGKKRKLGREVAVVGAGMSKFGIFGDKNSKDLPLSSFPS
ncbi:unnamed protein product, partial [marine sediment metagenome]